MKKLILLLSLALFIACGDKETEKDTSENTKDTVAQPEELEYKVLDSEFILLDSLWAPFEQELAAFADDRYSELKENLLEADIPAIQEQIKNGELSYEELVLFYLHRIKKYDRENELSLNSVISLNKDILKEAREKDEALKNGGDRHPIFGIPVLLKDNINSEIASTTAGSVALRNNETEDAYIVEQLKKNGALILGKANLSEWAYFFCGDCPSGYSAIGGQTLNPYGRKIFDTGGSSSGSAVAVAANLAPVSIGSETSGSILSPSSQNSLVGLKPTIGLLSRGGIVPISGTLDTPGPITKSVVDNAILLSAMTGKDDTDPASEGFAAPVQDYYSDLKNASVAGKRFGAIKELMEDTLYVRAVEDLRKAGAEVVEFEAEEVELPNFVRLLNLDMKNDLPEYFDKYGGNTGFSSVEDLVKFNIEDSTLRMPYGQALFEGILQDSASAEDFAAIKDTLNRNGKQFFDVPMKQHDLDAVLSINNYHAGFAAVAKYPAITVPMGFNEEGAPKGLTMITTPNGEQNLLSWAAAYEKQSKRREAPEKYTD
ncbi:MAG: amidase family protein [Salegentibacter sp.]|uniref:amidase family protein n=1 Tax=Salegentibacter sp. TaxID=1903072 RepID=UPI00286FBD77|nr:amidase family protein [Salegentibacter sp.]MDR9457016.1 amidase family protein [Salegentibacter sp.]